MRRITCSLQLRVGLVTTNGDAILEAVDGFDTVCIGLSKRADDTGLLYGSVTERIARDARGNIALVRGP